MADVIHSEGFPKGWHIQERSAAEALLVRRTGKWPGTTTVCLKPFAIPLGDWMPTAQLIARMFEEAMSKEGQSGE